MSSNTRPAPDRGWAAERNANIRRQAAAEISRILRRVAYATSEEVKAVTIGHVDGTYKVHVHPWRDRAHRS